jgi:hypothetical protein
VRAVLIIAALLGLCANAPATPMSFPTRFIDSIPADLDFPLPAIGSELVFDPGDLPDALVMRLPQDRTPPRPDPTAATLILIGLVSTGLAVVLMPIPGIVLSLQQPRRSDNWRKVRREIRKMA